MSFDSDRGTIVAVDNVNLHVDSGETLGIVGDSGSGKSVTSLSVMRLVARPPGRVAAGEIKFEGDDLLRKGEADMRRVRGNRIAMIYQEPMTSLNPVFTIGAQIVEAITFHLGLSKGAARAGSRLAAAGRNIGAGAPH